MCVQIRAKLNDLKINLNGINIKLAGKTYSIYPKVNYFSKIEDHIILENGQFEFLKTYFIIENNDK